MQSSICSIVRFPKKVLLKLLGDVVYTVKGLTKLARSHPMQFTFLGAIKLISGALCLWFYLILSVFIFNSIFGTQFSDLLNKKQDDRYKVTYIFPEYQQVDIPADSEIIMNIQGDSDQVMDDFKKMIKIKNQKGERVIYKVRHEDSDLYVIQPEESLDYGTGYSIGFDDDYIKNSMKYVFTTELSHEGFTSEPRMCGNSVTIKKDESFYMRFNKDIDSFAQYEINRWYKFSETSDVGLDLVDDSNNIQIMFLDGKTVKIHIFDYPQTVNIATLKLDAEKLKSGDHVYSGINSIQMKFGRDVGGYSYIEGSTAEIREGTRDHIKVFLKAVFDPDILDEKSVVANNDSEDNENVSIEYSVSKYTVAEAETFGVSISEESIAFGYVWCIDIIPVSPWESSGNGYASVRVEILSNKISTDETEVKLGSLWVHMIVKIAFNIVSQEENEIVNGVLETNTRALKISSNTCVSLSEDNKGEYIVLFENDVPISLDVVTASSYFLSLDLSKLKVGATYKLVFKRGISKCWEDMVFENDQTITFKIVSIPDLFPSVFIYKQDFISYFTENDDLKYATKAINTDITANLYKYKGANNVTAILKVYSDFRQVGFVENDDLFLKVDSKTITAPSGSRNYMYYRELNFGNREEGIYILETDSSARCNDTFIVVSDLNLMVSDAQNQIMTYVTNVSNGEPVSNATVSCLVDKSELRGETDSSGMYLFEFSSSNKGDLICSVEQGDDLSFVYKSDMTMSYGYYSSTDEFTGVIVTDREAYDNNDTISYKYIIRNRDGSSVADEDLYVRIGLSTADEQIYTSEKLELNEFGSVSGQMDIVNQAGSLDVIARVYDKDNNLLSSEKKQVYITRLLPSTFQAQVYFDKSEYGEGETAQLSLNALTYATAKEQYKASIKVYYYIAHSYVEEYQSSIINDESKDCCERVIIYEKDIMTDQYGNVSVNLPLPKEVNSYNTLMAEVTVTNSVGESVSVVSVSSIMPKYLILRDYRNYYEATTIRVVNSQNVPQSGININVSVLKTTEEYYYEEIDGTLIKKSRIITEEIDNYDTKSATDGTIQLSAQNYPVNTTYQVILTVEDILATTYISNYKYDGSGTETLTSAYLSALYDTNNIVMQLDKNEYYLNDKAIITGTLPESGFNVLITVERDGKVLEVKTLQNVNKEFSYIYDVDDKSFPNVYLRFYFSRGIDLSQTKVPDSYVGTIDIIVKKDINLDVNVITDKDSYKPKDTVELSISNGKNEQSEYMVAVVDKAVLELMNRDDIDFWTRLFGPRNYHNEFGTSDNIHFYMSRINNKIWTLFQEKVVATKGGGGGTGESTGEVDLQVLRKDFEYVAYFEGAIVSDSAGNATVIFTLPDNITTWNIYIVGVSKDGNFSETKHDFVSKYDVYMNSYVPSYLYDGDTYEATYSIYNTTTSDVEGTFKASCQGCKNWQNIEKDLTVTTDGLNIQTFDITPSSPVQSVKVTASFVKGDNCYDAVESNIDVYRPVIRVTDSVGGYSANEYNELVYSPPLDSLGKKAELKIVVGVDPRVFMPSITTTVGGYRYLCSEQASTKILSYIYSEKYGMISGDIAETYINELITIVLQNQNYDGGFGVWNGSFSTVETSTVVYKALIVAKQNGYNINEDVINDVREYVLGDIHKRGAYSLMILATLVDLDENIMDFASDIESFQEQDDRVIDNIYKARIYYKLYQEYEDQKALWESNPYKNLYKEQVEIIMNYAIEDKNGVYWVSTNNMMFSSAVYTTTVEALKSLVYTNYENDNYIKGGFSWIKSNKPMSTHDLDILAETIDMYNTSSRFKLKSVKVNGQQVDMVNTGNYFEGTYIIEDVSDEYDVAIDASETFYYSVYMSYDADFMEMDNRSNGGIIDKEIYDTADNLVLDSKFAKNTRYTVKLTLLGDYNSSNVIVSDGIPAGISVMDYNLDRVGFASDTPRTYWYNYSWMQQSDNVFVYEKYVNFYKPYMYSKVVTYSYDIIAVANGTFSLEPVMCESMYSGELSSKDPNETVTIE